MLPILNKKSIIIKSLEFLPEWFVQEKSSYPNSTSGLEWKASGFGEITVAVCCSPLFNYLSPHLIMFRESRTLPPRMFLLLAEAPTVGFSQVLKLDFHFSMNSTLFIDDAPGESEKREQARKDLAFRLSSAIPRFESLQKLVISNASHDDIREHLLQNISKLRRLQSLVWGPLTLAPAYVQSSVVAGGTGWAHFFSSQPPRPFFILRSCPLVELDFYNTDPTETELALVLSSVSHTLRALTLGGLYSSLSTRSTLEIIAANCPRLESLSMLNLVIENEDSLSPFHDLCELRKITLNTLFGLLYTRGNPSLGNYFPTIGNDGRKAEIDARLRARSVEEVEGARRSFRHFQNCSGSLEEFILTGDIHFGSETPLLAFFGKLDHDNNSDEFCSYPRLRHLEFQNWSLFSERALLCFNSQLLPNLEKLDSFNTYTTNTKSEITERVFQNAFPTLSKLKAISFPNITFGNSFEIGDALMDLFFSSSVKIENDDDDDEEEENNKNNNSTPLQRSLEKVVVPVCLSSETGARKGGFEKENVEKYIQRQQQKLLLSDKMNLQHQFCGRNLKSLFIAAVISDEFLKILCESTQVQATLEHLRIGSQSCPNENISDEGIFHLRHLEKNLNDLTLFKFTAVTSYGWLKLVRILRNLRGFSIPGAIQVNESIFPAMQHLVDLYCIEFDQAPEITGEGLKHLTKLNRLNCVMLTNCANMKNPEFLRPLDSSMAANGYFDVNGSGFFECCDTGNDTDVDPKEIMEQLNEVLGSWRATGGMVNGY
jgi:hypothetical protein